MKKRYFLTLLSIMLIFHLGAQTNFTVNTINYTTTGASTVKVAVNANAIGKITIPETVSYAGTTYSVTSIGLQAFMNCVDLISVTLPSGITSIGSQAFYGCSNLNSINLPGGLTKIDGWAFRDCSSLTSIDIPAGIDAISDNTFDGCKGIISLTLPTGLKTVGSQAFANMSISILNLPLGLTSIGSGAFFNLKNMSTISLPAGITTIEHGTFAGCLKLLNVNFSPNIISIGNNAFQNCGSLTSINLPSKLTTIGNRAFLSCYGLTSISLPSSVISIGDNTFESCAKLSTVDLSANLTTIGSSAFLNCSSLKTIVLPATVNAIGDFAFQNCTSLKSIFPRSLTPVNLSASTSAFSGVSNCYLWVPSASLSAYNAAPVWNNNLIILEQPTVYSNGINSIKFLVTSTTTAEVIANGYSPYTGNITIPETAFCWGTSIPVTAIGANAFKQCTGLTAINFPESITSIGEKAFYLCTGLSSIILPNSIKTIDKMAFLGCDGLSNVYLPEGLTTIGQAAFNSCTNLTAIDLPASLTSIADQAFQGCVGVTSVAARSTTPIDLSLSTAAFLGVKANCVLYVPQTALTAYQGATVWKNFTSIQASAASQSFMVDPFYYKTTGLSTVELVATSSSGVVTIPVTVNYLGSIYTVTSIGLNAFKNIKTITSVVIPNTVTALGIGAFYGCSGLTSISLPDGISEIPEKAFLSCFGLTSVKFPANLHTIGNIAFSGCDGLTSVVFPTGLTSVGTYAFDNCAGLTSIDLPAGLTSISNYAFSTCSKLASITARAILPIDMSAALSAFTGMKASCVLYVPQASLTAYQSATVWKDFSSIQGSTLTSIYSLTGSELGISVANGKLKLYNLNLGETLNIYTMTGVKMYSTCNTNSSIEISLPAHQVYIMQIGNRTTKVML